MLTVKSCSICHATHGDSNFLLKSRRADIEARLLDASRVSREAPATFPLARRTRRGEVSLASSESSFALADLARVDLSSCFSLLFFFFFFLPVVNERPAPSMFNLRDKKGRKKSAIISSVVVSYSPGDILAHRSAIRDRIRARARYTHDYSLSPRSSAARSTSRRCVECVRACDLCPPSLSLYLSLVFFFISALPHSRFSRSLVYRDSHRDDPCDPRLDWFPGSLSPSASPGRVFSLADDGRTDGRTDGRAIARPRERQVGACNEGESRRARARRP